MRRSQFAASPVSLGALETDDAAPLKTSRRLSTSPTQLLTQIEPGDIPPPPNPDSEPISDSLDAFQPRSAPSAELMDVEPMPPVPTPTMTAAPASATVPLSNERQELQLARIALGIEQLARQATQTIVERIAIEPSPVRPDVFVTPAERGTTAIIRIERTAEDRDRFSLSVHAAPVQDVFDVLCDLAGLKLEVAPEVTDRVTMTIRDVTLGEAINAVLKHSNLGVERDEHWLRVMPRTMAENRALRQQPLDTQIYRPQVLRCAEVLPLIRPLLTPGIGRLAVMPDPAGKLCPEDSELLSGMASEILVIVDRAEVHAEVEKLLRELDGKMTTP